MEAKKRTQSKESKQAHKAEKTVMVTLKNENKKLKTSNEDLKQQNVSLKKRLKELQETPNNPLAQAENATLGMSKKLKVESRNSKPILTTEMLPLLPSKCNFPEPNPNN